MSNPRELPNFLKAGDADLGAGRPRYPGMQIGRGFPEARPIAVPRGGDPASERDWVVWEWLDMCAKATNRSLSD